MLANKLVSAVANFATSIDYFNQFYLQVVTVSSLLDKRKKKSVVNKYKLLFILDLGHLLMC